jgi:ABC-type multidrug transport system ATPase subunit
MIDEPELNLHPENQRCFARLMARLANIGIKVFITTHSDYIVKELNTLIMLNRDEPHIKRIREKYGYKEDERLSVDQLRVYIAKEALRDLPGYARRKRVPTLVEAKIDPELGVFLESFDETINEMNEIQKSVFLGG